MNAITKFELRRPELLSHKPTVLVLGGYGFIGRHIVTQLENLNARVLIGTRREKNTLSPSNQRCIALHKLNSNPAWKKQLEGVDVIVNAVGILRQRWGETYEQVHHQAVAELARVCAKQDIRLIHISALGLNNPVKSRFLKSKRLGEQALAKSHADWHLVRPSLVDGEGGYGAKWFRRVAQWPVYFVPANAHGTFAPIKASELGKAVVAIALSKNKQALSKPINRIHELSGETKMSLRQYIDALRPSDCSAAVTCIKIPALVSRLLSHACDALHLTPFSFGHYELLKNDNLPTHNCLAERLIEWDVCKRSITGLLSVE